MTFQPSAPHKRSRWLALFVMVMLATTLVATAALATPTFTLAPDDQGANDEPGQKDLTADGAANDAGHFWTTWLWDDTSWSGKNTGDACSLLDTDNDGDANYAVCVTVATKNAVETSTRIYSCTDGRPDRCTGSALLAAQTVNVYCTVGNTNLGPFDTSDTQAKCDITAAMTSVNISATFVLLNSCSYPSQQPNSDPSDCVHEIPNLDVALDTASGGSIAWQATLTDEVNTTPAAAGSVVFELWPDASCADAGGALYTSSSIALDASGSASTSTTVITSLNDPGSGTYYWKVSYTPDAGYNAAGPLCGEAVTITASVDGSTQP